MKKWLSILGTIGLTATSTITLVSCEKPVKNENEGDNKPEPPYNPQQPLEGSNWKLDNNPNFINYKVDDKWYIAIFKNYTKDWYIVNFLNDSRNDKILGEFCFNGTCQNLYLSSLREFFKRGDVKTVYQWNGINNPNTPEINKSTGKITDWKE